MPASDGTSTDTPSRRSTDDPQRPTIGTPERPDGAGRSAASATPAARLEALMAWIGERRAPGGTPLVSVRSQSPCRYWPGCRANSRLQATLIRLGSERAPVTAPSALQENGCRSQHLFAVAPDSPERAMECRSAGSGWRQEISDPERWRPPTSAPHRKPRCAVGRSRFHCSPGGDGHPPRAPSRTAVNEAPGAAASFLSVLPDMLRQWRAHPKSGPDPSTSPRFASIQ